MLTVPKRQGGLSLLELLIGIIITGIALAAVITMFTVLFGANQRTIEQGKLTQELATIMNIMTTDIQRAGYWSLATSSSVNPFMVTGTTDITVNAAQNCVILTYDHDGDGLLPAISSSIDDERYGYRLDNDTIQFRPAGASFSCSAASSAWENLSDPNVIKITTFTVVYNNQAVDIDGTGPGTATTNYRSITVTITGELVKSSTSTQTFTRTIKVTNNKYIP